MKFLYKTANILPTKCLMDPWKSLQKTSFIFSHTQTSDQKQKIPKTRNSSLRNKKKETTLQKMKLFGPSGKNP